MYCKHILMTLLVILGVAISTHAQVIEKSKHFDRTFSLQRSVEVSVSNKYGNIHIINWDKDSVRFVVDMVVRSTKQARVDKVFNEIDIKFSQTPYYVMAISTFPNTGKLWSEISDVTKSVINASNEAEIDYTIYLPSWVRLKVENRFGNIYTTDHEGETEFKLSNGMFQANNLEGKSKLVISFGSANINQINDGSIELNYSDLDLRKINKVQLTGRSSNMRIEEAGHIHLDSRRDKLSIGQLQSLSGESSFSRIVINSLNRDMMLSSNYGNLNLMKINGQMQFLQLNASYTNIQVFVQPQLSAELEILHSKKTKLNYPSAMTISDRVEAISENEFSLIKGRIGKEKGCNLKFNLTGGELNIILKQ